MSQRGAERALSDLVAWQGGNEPDSYPYFKDFFCAVLGYPKEKVKVNESGTRGFPDITLYSKDGIPWVVCEVKPDRKLFRTEKNQHDIWNDQLKRYVTADTVYAVLLDPATMVLLTPDGRPHGSPLELDKISVKALRDPASQTGIQFLDYESSFGSRALEGFITAQAPTHYIDVLTDEGLQSFYTALRNSARELRDYAIQRVKQHLAAYEEYISKRDELEKASMQKTARLAEERELHTKYRESIDLQENVIKYFIAQMGREIPKKQDEEEFIQRVYATEAANLVLARILFVRFFEDYGMTTTKISNGGIAQFRNFHRHVRDDYRFLLESAFRDTKALYARLFEESIFDWAHEGDGELSRILLRVFYRLNAFDFAQITGDILGNLYERFLDPASRKDMGEFYTPQFVADYILDAIGFKGEPGPILDPACGSGTFLFRAIELAIQSFRQKGIPYRDAIEQAVKLVHGLDVNIFAAFIAQLQVIWHLFPHLRLAGATQIPELKIYGGLDSLESGIPATLEQYFQAPREDAARTIRDARYRFVVGNPPYIRAERLKVPTRWSDYYKRVATGKKDVAYYFLCRAIEGGEHTTGVLPPWLEDGGRMGFIVSFGIADSDAALALRQLLLQHRLIELVDLESLSNEVFTSGIATGRSTVAPIIIVGARSKTEMDNYNVKVTLATRQACLKGAVVDLFAGPSSLVPKSVFSDAAINPFQQFATKIQAGDLPILKKLFSNMLLQDFAARTSGRHVAISVGIQTGLGGGKIFDRPAKGRYLMARGLHVHSFALNSQQITEYVDLSKVENKSIWAKEELVGKMGYALSEIGFAPQACAFDTGKIVAQKSCVVFIPNDDSIHFPWEIYLNSRIPRYVFGLVLRSALIEGTREGDIWRATINPDAVKYFPVSQGLLDSQKELSPKSRELEKLASRILNRWQTIDAQIRESQKTTIALLPLRHVNVINYHLFKALPVQFTESRFPK
jgi:hypothetical protein